MITRKARNRALTFSAVGVYAVSLMIGCSSDPSAPGTIARAGASSAGAATAGAATAGAPTAGAATAGAPSAGADTGGTGGATAGSGGDAAGAAPTAGAPIGFCSPMATPVQTREALPYLATKGFIPSAYENNTTITTVDCAAGTTAPPHVAMNDLCQNYTVTPDMVTPAYAGIGWVRQFDPQYKHPPVCIADGVTFVNFWAKGAAGGEKITVTAQGADETEVTLTTAWAQYQIPMAGKIYNLDAEGVELGFYWKYVPPALPPAPPVTFSIDHVTWIGGAAGGAGGAGGAPAAGGGGAGGAPAGAGGTAG